MQSNLCEFYYCSFQRSSTAIRKMTRSKTLFYCTLILSLTVIILLATGSSLLTIPLDSNNSIPLGTFITWIGMISLPISSLFGSKGSQKAINATEQNFVGVSQIDNPLGNPLGSNIVFTRWQSVVFVFGERNISRWPGCYEMVLAAELRHWNRGRFNTRGILDFVTIHKKIVLNTANHNVHK